MIKIFIPKIGQVIWQFPEIGHLICQLDLNEDRDSKIAYNLCRVMVTSLNLSRTNNLTRRQIICQSIFSVSLRAEAWLFEVYCFTFSATRTTTD